jgi:DNA-binding MarR family transcriptional regulator
MKQQHAKSVDGVLTPGNLPYRMRLLVQAMTRHFQDLLQEYDITPLHWGVLSCLWREDGQATQAIAQTLQQLGGTLTVGIDAMERRGLVKRKRDNLDGRIVRVCLTKKGRAMEGAIVPKVEEFVGRLFACFSEKEYSEFSKSVDRLREHLG